MFPNARISHVVRVMSSVRPDLNPAVIDNGGHLPEAEFGRGKRWGFTADLSRGEIMVTAQVYDATESPALVQGICVRRWGRHGL